EQKQGGAGLGIYTALGNVNQLVVNVDQGVKTEVIALWDLERRGRGTGASPGSLHVFASDESAARARHRAATGDHTEAVPQATAVLPESTDREIGQRADRRDTIVGMPPL